MAQVLVCDDEDGLRSFLAEALELAGHEVTQARHGQHALSILEEQGFHLLLTDLRMPRMDGMSLIRETLTTYPEMEVVVLTAHGSVKSAVEAMKLGAFDYLTKPLGSPAELRLVVQRALERRGLRGLRDATRTEGPTLTWGATAMEPVVQALGKVAPTTAAVLLLGESGTGKEVTARAIHTRSGRSGPFTAVNCAALSENLLESELFGHEKGAFTGASDRKRGKIELTEGGTFFLDEVGELHPSLQAKLLRVLQEKTFERVGGHQTLTADVRWIAATNRDLGQMIGEGTFREDLYHRLAVFPIRLPPLRDRPEDLVPLAQTLLRELSAELGRPGLALSDAAQDTLRAESWPGNVRELRNVLERACILAEGGVIDTDHLWLDPTATSSTTTPLQTLEELERDAIARTLAAMDGNRRKTAEVLGIAVRTLYDKLKRYDLG